MKKFKNRQRPRRKCRFDIVGHKKSFKIWCDSLFNQLFEPPYKYCLWRKKNKTPLPITVICWKDIKLSFRSSYIGSGSTAVSMWKSYPDTCNKWSGSAIPYMYTVLGDSMRSLRYQYFPVPGTVISNLELDLVCLLPLLELLHRDDGQGGHLPLQVVSVPVAYNGNQFSGCPYSYNKKRIQPTVLETQKIWLELVTPVLFLLKINYRISQTRSVSFSLSVETLLYNIHE